MAVIRKTKTVKLVLEAFYKANDAMSIVELVQKFNNEMDKTTVYRILERLEGSGILHSFMGKDGLKRYAKSEQKFNILNDKSIHPHFICTDCGNSSCLSIKVLIPTLPNYIVESAEQLLIGKCKDCIS